MGNEDFRDVALETQDGKPVAMSDTDREALVMGMALHDKAQQFLQMVSASLMLSLRIKACSSSHPNAYNCKATEFPKTEHCHSLVSEALRKFCGL